MLFLTRLSDLFGQEREQLAKALEALEPFWANYPDLRKCCFQRRDRRVVLGNPEKPTTSRRSQEFREDYLAFTPEVTDRCALVDIVSSGGMRRTAKLKGFLEELGYA